MQSRVLLRFDFRLLTLKIDFLARLLPKALLKQGLALLLGELGAFEQLLRNDGLACFDESLTL